MRKILLLLVLIFPIGIRAQLTYPTVKTQNCPTAGKTCQIPTQNGNVAYNITLTGDVLYPITDIGSNGAEMYLNICQDATGGHNWVWPSGFTNPPAILQSGTSCSPVTFVNKGGGIWLNEGIGNGLGSGGGGGGSLFGSTDPVGVCINGTLYTNTTTPSFWICQNGTWVKNSGTPGGAAFQAQFNNSGAFGGSNCFNLSAFPNGPASLDCDTHPIGPNPSSDITRYGARYVTATPQANVSCVSGTNTLVESGNTGNAFIVGDYILVPGCGTPITVATPNAPSVTSGSSRMQTVPDARIVSVTGASTYSYLLVTKDFNGGLTLPGTATTITNGVSIGQQTATVSSVVSTGQTLTISLGSNGPPNGTLFHLTYVAQGVNQTSHKFDGYYNVSSGGGTSTIVVKNVPFSSYTTDSTAASIIWFNGNAISWTNQAGAFAQYVCGKRPGDVSFHFLGSSVPASGNGPPFTQWIDWGNTLTPATPAAIPEGTDAICSAGSATNDYLDNVQITSCTGSTTIGPVTTCPTGSTWTISGSAGTTKSGVAVQDSAPALTAANAASNVNVGTALTIPCLNNVSTQFMIFASPQYLTSQRNWIDQCGSVSLTETIDLGNVAGTFSMPWIGRVPLMINSSASPIFFSAYPALNNTGVIHNVSFQDQGPENIAVLENTNQSSNGNETIMMDHNEFSGGISSIGIFAIGVFPFGYLTNTKHSFSPGNSPGNYDKTWTPWLYLDGGGELYYRNSYGFGRGTFINQTNTAGPALLEFNQYYIQGSIMPLIGYFGAQGTSGSINLVPSVSDTSPQSVIVLEVDPANPPSNFIVRPKDLAGLPVNLISGWSPTVIYDEFNYGGNPGFPLLANVLPDNSTGYGRLALQTGTRSDGFNRANGGLGSNWTNQLNSINITGNQILGSNGGWNVAYMQSTSPIPNSYPNPFTGGEFCQVTVENYGAGDAGCTVYTSPGAGYACYADGSNVFIAIPNSLGVASGTYSGGGAGDQLFETAIASKGAATQLSCTVFPVLGTPVTITGTDSNFNTGFPGVAIFGVAAIEDAFAGGTINPNIVPTVENYFTQPNHFAALTIGNAAPIAGALPYGFLSTNTAVIGNYIDFVQQPNSPSFGNPSAGNCRGFFAFGGNMSFINSTGASCGPSGGGSMVFPNTVGLVRWTGGAAWAPSVNDTTALTGQPLVATNGLSSGFSSPGIQDGNGAAHVTTTPYVVLCDSASTIRDRGTTIVFDAGASVVTLPDHTASGCGNNNAFVLINNTGGSLTVNRGGADTLDIYGLGTNPTIAGTSFTLQNNAWAALNNGESTRWNVRMGGGLELTKVTTTTGTGAISGNSCTAPTTVTMTGLTSTQTLVFTPNADISGLTGWGSTGGLVIEDWPSANTVNYRVCNQTGSSITPGGSVTWNVSAQ